jgi:hypothetical protein
VRRGRFAGVDLPFAQKNLRFFSKDFNRRIFGCAFFIAATLVAAPQCYLMTSFLSEKIFYHGYTRMDTDGKEGSTRLDTDCANYRQLNSVNSRNSHLALIRNAILQLRARMTKIWTAVAERSGDIAFRATGCFQKRRGASLPAAVQNLWLRPKAALGSSVSIRG